MLQNSPGFLPGTAAEWLELLRNGVLVTIAVGGILWKVFVRELNRVSQRLDLQDAAQQQDIESVRRDCASNQAVQQELARLQTVASGERETMNRDLGRLESMVERIVSVADERQKDRTATDREIVERLARIEARHDLAGAMDRGFDRIAAALSARDQSKN